MDFGRGRSRFLDQVARASARYLQRTAKRRDIESRLVAGGPGAADSQTRQAELVQRDALRSELKTLVARGRVKLGEERIFGTTYDILDVAPSEVARAAGRPVARIVYRPEKHLEPEPIATGFLVGPRLLLTNNHVISIPADVPGLCAQFLFERSEAGIHRGVFFALDASSLFITNEELDFTLIAVAPVNEDGEQLDQFGFVQMIEATPKTAIGDPANIIQHPNGASKGYAISRNRVIDIHEPGYYLNYETDTQEGSSGSPVFNKHWELIGLHHSAVPKLVEGAYWHESGRPWDKENDTLKDLAWESNEGTRCSSIVKALRDHVANGDSERQLMEAFLATTADPLERVSQLVSESRNARNSISTREEPLMASVVVNISGPVTLNINMSVSGVQLRSEPLTAASTHAPQEISRPAALSAALEKKQNFDTNYEGRKGYDPMFLGRRIDLPKADEGLKKELLALDGRPWVIPYHHFSLVMHEKRRLCVWSAVNVHYGTDMRDERSRDEFGGEDWRLDDRIADALDDTYQIVDGEFYKPAQNVDRGHIVRREDNCWGASRREREYANADTYHWTNCTPQHEAFNQENARGYADKGVWGWFERELQKEIAAQSDPRAIIFAGPFLNSRDPSVTIAGRKQRYPLKFWKVVLYRPDDASGSFRSMGFVFDQSDVVQAHGLGLEEIDQRLKRYQVRIEKLSDDIKIRFDSEVYKYDALAAREIDSVPLRRRDDVVGIPRSQS